VQVPSAVVTVISETGEPEKGVVVGSGGITAAKAGLNLAIASSVSHEP
jgi:hypothetical protein